MHTEEVDLLVVGGGKAGKSLAMDRAKAGWSVVMVERDKIGGTCINVACIPTKALVGSARTLLAARGAERMGVEVGGEPSVSLDLLRHHKDSVVGGMVSAHEDLFAESGMDFVLGTARFVAERTVEIAAAEGPARSVRGRDVVINTGTAPAVPDLPGLADSNPWTTEAILHLERLPATMLVIGGGYVGCEFASMFAAFGTEVTVLQGAEQLLPREDPDVAAAVADVLRGQGVELRLGARAASAQRAAGGGEVTVTLEDGSEARGEDLLVATGRTPVTAELGLDAAGVAMDGHGFVEVDDHLRTSAERTWAAGDVAGSPQFTHASWHDFRILRENLTGRDAVTTGRLVPYTVFTTPELARVGMSEREATAAGHRVRVASLPVAAIPRSKTLHLVEDRRGVVWVRASAPAGSATSAQALELGASGSPVMTRQVLVGTPAEDWHGDSGVRPVVTVADIDLSDVAPPTLSCLVWAVATFAGAWRGIEWSCDALPPVPVTALDASRSTDQLEVLERWSPSLLLLIPDPPESQLDLPDPLADRSTSSEPDEFDDLSELAERFESVALGSPRRRTLSPATLHDPTCRFHTPPPADAEGLCDDCARSLRAGGRDLLETLHDRGVLTSWEYDEIAGSFDGLVDSLRLRQAETRLALKVAQRAPIRDLSRLDPDEARRRLARLVGTDNPTYRAGCEIIDVLVRDGRNEPVLLVGPAGLGKTHIAKLIASVVLDLPVHLVSLGVAAGRHAICGSDLAFRNADRGAVVGGIVAFRTLQFLLVLDELEKLAGHASDDYPLASLLAMFDDQRASFTDSFVGSEPGWQLDLTSTIFIATANERQPIPEPVLSRMRVIDVPAWTAEEKLALARREAARFEQELGLERQIPIEVLQLIVAGCPEPGIRELLRALERYRSTLARNRDGVEVDPLTVFPPAPPTPVVGRVRPAPSMPGVTRTVTLTPHGWQELRCTATPNGTRWAGSIDALGADGDTFLLHWVPTVEAAIGTSIPPCTVHLDPPSLGPHLPAGLSLAVLAAVTSAATGLAPDHRVLAPLRADPHGRLAEPELSAADVAGLGALGVATVALAGPREGRGLEWTRADLPQVVVATELVELVRLLLPGLDRTQRPRDDVAWGGYL